MLISALRIALLNSETFTQHKHSPVFSVYFLFLRFYTLAVRSRKAALSSVAFFLGGTLRARVGLVVSRLGTYPRILATLVAFQFRERDTPHRLAPFGVWAGSRFAPERPQSKVPGTQ